VIGDKTDEGSAAEEDAPADADGWNLPTSHEPPKSGQGKAEELSCLTTSHDLTICGNARACRAW
jgi:hypothetical protein